MSKISIIVPIYNEERYIIKCLDSLISNGYNITDIEILLIDGGSNDTTLEIIGSYQKKYSFIKQINNPAKIAPIAMNLGIKKANGKYIFIISAHACYEKGYFSQLIKYMDQLDADCIGPVLNTDIKNKNYISCAIKNVLSDKFGVGSTFRSGVSKIQEVDTVPFGCYKKEVFDQIGLYDERLVRNQDIELNKRLKKAGGKIFITPDIKATYFARESFKELAKNNFDNGKWNILTAYYTKTFSSLSFRHFVPLLFILAIFLPLLCCYQVSAVLILFYFFVIIVRSIIIKKETTLLHQVLAFMILHFSYGIGEVVGIVLLVPLYLKRVKHFLMNLKLSLK